MRHLLFALPLLLGFVQDEAAIRDLIKKLDDADVEVREKALAELIKAGTNALDPLRQAAKSESAELRARATQAIRTIEHQLKASEVCPAYTPVNFKRSGTVGEILGELSKLTGLKLEANGEHRALNASVDAATLYQALDQICAAQEKFTYSVGDDGAIKFLGERHSTGPASYYEAFKISVTNTAVMKKNDFKDLTVVGQFMIATLWEGTLKPLRRVRYEVAEAKDDKGKDLEISTGPGGFENVGMGGNFAFAGAFAGFGGGAEDPLAQKMFTVKGLSQDSKSILSLKGKVIVCFPHPPVPVEFAELQAGTSQTVGDVVIKVQRLEIKQGRITLAFTKAKGEGNIPIDEILGRVGAGSVVAVDEDGKEHAGELMSSANDGGGLGWILAGAGGGGGGNRDQGQGTLAYARFTDLEKKDVKTLKFRFSEALYEKTVPFEIKEIKLP